MNELDKLAELLTERHHALRNYPSDGGNPTTSLSGALIAIKEIIEAIHTVHGESRTEHTPLEYTIPK